MTDHCADCRYFAAATGPTGECRRYPVVTNKPPGGWCGEHGMPTIAELLMTLVGAQEMANNPVMAVGPECLPSAETQAMLDARPGEVEWVKDAATADVYPGEFVNVPKPSPDTLAEAQELADKLGRRHSGFPEPPKPAPRKRKRRKK